MLTSAILVQQLVDQIKVEGRVAGANTYDITILAIINELLLEYSEKDRYAAFLVKGAPVVLAVATSDYELPADFSNIRTVYFWRQGQPVMARTLRFKGDFVEQSRDGLEPKWYEIVGDTISIFPFGDVKLTDNMTIDYWKVPNALELTDTFPVPKLIPVIKKAAIARMHTVNSKINEADRFNAQADKISTQEDTTEDNGDTQ